MKNVFLLGILVFALSDLLHAQWTNQASGFPHESTGAFYISMVNKDIVWVSARNGLSYPYISNEFSRTINGGITWTAGQVIPGPAVYDIANISAVDSLTAWAAIYQSYGAQDTNCGIYKTTDGGLTWLQQFAIQAGTSTFPNNVYFWNANEGMFEGDVRDGYFEIYTTSDGGSSWVRVPQSNINATLKAGDAGMIRSIETVGDSMICFISYKSDLYISTDRGSHWIGKPTGITMPPNPWYHNIAFRDINHGLIGLAPSTATTMNIYETSNCGDTWTLVNSTGPINIFGLAAVPGSPNTYVSTGQNASMMGNNPILNNPDSTTDLPALANSGVTYSFDGGHTWKKMPSTDGKHFLGIKWLNDSVSFSGSWTNSPTNDGMWKFTSSLEEANFTASDSMINVGDQVNFSIISGGHSTSTFNWTFDGGSPATSTSRNPVVSYNTKGVYSVTLDVTNTWGHSIKVKTAYIYAGCGVGIENHSSGSVLVFPDPADDLLNINGDMPILWIRIADMTGREVLSRKINDRNATIRTSGLKTGVYTLIVQMQNNTINRKVIIK
ncbi:MAG: T9SS type A sorting domain-containing protein [Bacteroidota bacterium]